MKYNLFLLPILLLAIGRPVSAQSDGDPIQLYTAEMERDVLPPGWDATIHPSATQDTSAANAVYVGPFGAGYKVIRRDGRMGLLRADLTVRVPFAYVDIQRIETGLADPEGYVLIGRRSRRGRYAILDDAGQPVGGFVFSYNDRLRILKAFVVSSPRPGQFFVRYRNGEPVSPRAFSAVWPQPRLIANGVPVATVEEKKTGRQALLNIERGALVTGFDYEAITEVDPVLAPRAFLPVLEGRNLLGLHLLRPDGTLLSPQAFAGVEDYNNWRELRLFFGLPDDENAEAIAWTNKLDVYVLYRDNSVVRIGRYPTFGARD